jgi:hypothetical protein
LVSGGEAARKRYGEPERYRHPNGSVRAISAKGGMTTHLLFASGNGLVLGIGFHYAAKARKAMRGGYILR